MLDTKQRKPFDVTAITEGMEDFFDKEKQNANDTAGVRASAPGSLRRDVFASDSGRASSGPENHQTFTTPPNDPINPNHYRFHPSGVECIVITEHMNFNLGNAMKYIWRAGEKGNIVQDLEKARWYLDREITRLSV